MCVLRWLLVRTAQRAVSVDVRALRGPVYLSVSHTLPEMDVYLPLERLVEGIRHLGNPLIGNDCSGAN
jgi:hypothetical protein